MKKVLFVCTGNICRSPAAEGVLRKIAADAGQQWRVDSAGAGGWHIGEPPDERAAAACARRGYNISALRARQVVAEDFARFDCVYAMANEHLRFLRALAKTPADKAKIKMFAAADIPDPYFGGDAGFEKMMDLLEAGCRAIVANNND